MIIFNHPVMNQNSQGVNIKKWTQLNMKQEIHVNNEMP